MTKKRPLYEEEIKQVGSNLDSKAVGERRMSRQVEGNPELGDRFRVADWVVDVRGLTIAKSEESRHLEAKVMDLLVCLARRPGDVMTRQELEGKLWPGGLVSYHSLTTAIIKLRKAFGDSAKNPRIVETVPKIGYRLIAEIEPRIKKGMDHWESGNDYIAITPSLEPTELEPPEVPSIAVLPFTNMSGDPEQNYFSDGITEDIITALSKVKGIMVISRNSTATYKGKSVDVKQVGREQGVRHLLEGSLRKAGTRIRVTAQVVDAETGHHVWGERYDRDLEDIFEVQDEITREVIVALDVRFSGGEQARVWSGGTRNLEAWECVRRGMDVLNSGLREGPRESERLCKRALELDPNYPMAWVTLGWAYHHSVDVGIGHASNEDRETALDSSLECGNRALTLDPCFADAYSLLSVCHLSKHKHDEAIAMSERAVALGSNQAEILALAALVHNKSGQPEKSSRLVKRAMRFCPIYPGWFLWALGVSYRLTGQTDRAIEAFRAAINRDQDFLSLHVSLASTFGELDRKEDARKPVSEILRLDPEFSVKKYVAGLSYRDLQEIARFEDGLYKAGLPQ